jgi:hypothetical protein
LSQALDPFDSNNHFSKLIVETIIDKIEDLSHAERAWVSELQQAIEKEISLSLSLEDLKNFFRSKQEHTASSP